ncbi:hypothetical protein TTHT_1492 [Thermotomaculum hydrothermale]|uniref:Uncharacterized protein n=1 Tax=Thermotomaculum hydrothermale TaxID=981385 RepID=A0A7R6Q001_9BACT|nr:hypothetical protein [Thermotomaculum hydrothermale]BBB32998.1 hypothetical protein TTHT_1492 [Thermotomaculum hydrothermale]
MVVSYNDNLQFGNSVFHVQTEYYKATGTIICNIFKDGKALKKLKKKVEESQDLNQLISEFHDFVLNRLKEGAKLKEVKQTTAFKFYFPEELKAKIVDIIAPYFGAAMNVIWNDAVNNSPDIEAFVSNLLNDLDENLRVVIEHKVRFIIANSLNFKAGKKGVFIGNVERDKVLLAISPFFGVNANSVLDIAQSLYSGDIDKFKNIILKKYNGDKVSELENSLNRLFG